MVSTGQGILGNNMFAYCNNNPANYIDHKGTLPGHIDYLNSIQYEIPHQGEDARYPTSPHRQITGLINGQKLLAYSNQAFGNGTYGTSGCAVIAVYNALQLYGAPKSLGSIGDEFLDRFGTIGYGEYGVGPWSIGWYLDAYEISYIGSSYMPFVTKDIQEGSIIIFTVMNSLNPFEGFHTMAAQYVNGTYFVYNLGNYNSNVESFTSLNSAYATGVWIYGYRIDME